MRIKVHDGECAVAAGMRAQQWQRDGMVAAERQQSAAGFQNGSSFRLDGGMRRTQVHRRRVHIAVVHQAQMIQRCHAKHIVVAPQQQRELADFARPEAAARAVADAAVNRHAHYGHVRAHKLAGGGLAHKCGDAREGLQVGAERFVNRHVSIASAILSERKFIVQFYPCHQEGSLSVKSYRK